MKKNLAVIIVFILLVILVTFPLIVNINKDIPGFFSTDESFGTLWGIWRIKSLSMHKLFFSHVSVIAYPLGVDIYKPGFISYLWITLLYFLSILTTPILTFNLQVFLNFFFNAILTYLLVYYLTKKKSCGIFSGIIFAFCPYQFSRIWQHLGLTYNQLIPLSLFTAILLKEKKGKKYFFLFLISILLLFSFDFSIMYFGVTTLLTLFIFTIFYRWKEKISSKKFFLISDLKYFRNAFTAGVLAVIILSPQFLPIVLHRLNNSASSEASVFNLYRRPFEDLFSQSARPLSYFLPAVVHPIFGKFTEQFIGSSLYGVSLTEHTLYLGWVPLILAFVAFRKWRRERRLRAKSQEPRAREDFYISFFIFLAVVAWFFSQPPWWNIFGFKIYMPSFFMYKILPMYRAYCRFGIVLMLAVAVLAGFGLKFILLKLKAENLKLFVTILFCVLVLFEFWNYPPYKVIDVSKVPAVYYWLQGQPGDFVIAEYPLDADSPNEMYKFYQTKHEKKIINGTIPETEANRIAKTLTKLSEKSTASKLKEWGVKYAVVHRDGYLETGLIERIEELSKISKNPGLKFIKTFPAQECPRKDIICVAKTGPIDVYEVIAN